MPAQGTQISIRLTPGQNLLIHRILNVFETGAVEGRYDAISIYHDGPGHIRQITYGAKQTTEYGKLAKLVQMYVADGGSFAAALAPYVAQIGKTPLTDDATFKDLLQRAGRTDPMMGQTQDKFFDQAYFLPALAWADKQGFTKALSLLVIFDSFIHSGSILPLLRNKFPERPPSAGGREEVWVRQYTEVRHQWLSTHSNPDVRPSAYRTRDLLREIEAGNWDLGHLPFMANGTAVTVNLPVIPAADPVWSEIQPLMDTAPQPPQTATLPSAAALAQSILDSDRIGLATGHSEGPTDDATARQNIVDTSQGRAAHRSVYGTAPGGTVPLAIPMLSGLLALSQTWRVEVSEFCGGSHSPNSRHYAGVAFDIWQIDGLRVGASHPAQAAVRQKCLALGATEVLGPGDKGHDTHIHAAWPRP